MDLMLGNLDGRLQNSNPGVIAAAGAREVLRCPRCSLVQFRTVSELCRRCANPLIERPQAPLEDAGRLAGAKAGRSVSSSAKRDVLCEDPPLRDEITKKLALGCRLKELRKSANLTQAQIADKARVPRSYISRIEHSHLLPGPAMAHRLAEALGVQILDLFQNQGSDNEAPGSAKSLFWRSFVAHFQQLQIDQKSQVLYRVRAMLCERLHQQYRSQRRRPMPVGRFRLRARSA